jgi:hypothetical protein
MLLVTMLEKLAELTERFGAFWALVRQFWYGVLQVAAAVRELRNITNVTTHASLLRGKLIDLISRVVRSTTAAAVATFYVLNCVGSRTKAAISADRTSHITRPMDLLVHVELVLRTEALIACSTRKRDRRDSGIPSAVATPSKAIHTILTTRVAIALQPLVAAERLAALEAVAVSADASHGVETPFLLPVLVSLGEAMRRCADAANRQRHVLRVPKRISFPFAARPTAAAAARIARQLQSFWR